MFCTQEFSSLACIILQLFILYYLIKMYRALDPSENHQQPLTEARRNRGNYERINDRADPHIRHATEHDERPRGWVSVFSLWNCSKSVIDFFLRRSCTVYEINSALLICSGYTRERLDEIFYEKYLPRVNLWGKLAKFDCMQVSSVFYVMNLKLYFLF